MLEAQIAHGVQLLDLMLEYFSDDGHWARGRYDDGNGGHCLVGAVLYLSRKHRLPRAPAIDSAVEGDGFELVWGFSCQAVVLGCADSFLFGAGKAIFRSLIALQVAREFFPDPPADVVVDRGS